MMIKGGDDVNIKRIYYEELRSECVNGKWTSKKIGALVSVEKDDNCNFCLEYAKEYVRRNLDRENYAEKTTKQMLEDIQKQAKKIINGL